MSLARSTLGSAFLRPFVRRSTRISLATHRTYATQDYGSGAGDPKGEDPQDQGTNPRSDLEHPGPPAPKVAQGGAGSSGSAPSKESSSSSPSSSGGGSGGSQSSEKAASSSSSSSGSAKDDKTGGAQPKILSESPPSKEDQSGDVKQHNKEMEERADRSGARVADADVEKDKVS